MNANAAERSITSPDSTYQAVCNGPGLQKTLSHEEQIQLTDCEQMLRKGLATFFEEGSALLTIREARLYRESFSTFDAYCHQRWGIGRIYAWRVMGAAERVKLLPSEAPLPKPVNEFQIRPFLKLKPEEFPKVWEQTVAKANGGRITAKIVRCALAEAISACGIQRTACDKPKKLRLSNKCSPGEILVLLDRARRGIEKAELEEALGLLDRIELLLFGPCLSLPAARTEKPAKLKDPKPDSLSKGSSERA